MSYFRTIVEIEILSEDDPWDGELSDLLNDITDGDCSGTMKIKSNEEVTPRRMARLLQAQDSDPGFFGLDANGNELED
jgi:hypothetical protein